MPPYQQKRDEAIMFDAKIAEEALRYRRCNSKRLRPRRVPKTFTNVGDPITNRKK